LAPRPGGAEAGDIPTNIGTKGEMQHLGRRLKQAEGSIDISRILGANKL
jgi:hypothetical protein